MKKFSDNLIKILSLGIGLAIGIVLIAKVCFVIAVPVSIVIMRRYLEGFAYQVPLYIWVFAIALMAVLAVTIAVVTLRSLRAATVNPVKSLRSE